jgi:hypothetical protein
VGKYLAVLAILTVFCALFAALLAAILHGYGSIAAPASVSGPLTGWDPMALVVRSVSRWLEFNVLSAFTFLFGSFAAGSLDTLLMGFGVLAIGHLQYLTHEVYLRTGPALLRHLLQLAGLVFPDFQVFSLAKIIDPAGTAPLFRAAAYAFFYVLVAGGLTIFSFKRREI